MDGGCRSRAGQVEEGRLRSWAVAHFLANLMHCFGIRLLSPWHHCAPSPGSNGLQKPTTEIAGEMRKWQHINSVKEVSEPTQGSEKDNVPGGRELEFNAGGQEDRAVWPGEGTCIKLPCLFHCWCEKNVNDTKITSPGVVSWSALPSELGRKMGKSERYSFLYSCNHSCYSLGKRWSSTLLAWVRGVQDDLAMWEITCQKNIKAMDNAEPGTTIHLLH